jgi:hypothetical protein
MQTVRDHRHFCPPTLLAFADIGSSCTATPHHHSHIPLCLSVQLPAPVRLKMLPTSGMRNAPPSSTAVAALLLLALVVVTPPTADAQLWTTATKARQLLNGRGDGAQRSGQGVSTEGAEAEVYGDQQLTESTPGEHISHDLDGPIRRLTQTTPTWRYAQPIAFYRPVRDDHPDPDIGGKQHAPSWSV